MFLSIPARRGTRLSRALATHASNLQAARPAAHRTYLRKEIQTIYDTPLLDLVFRAAAVHRQHHDPSKVQLCTLMNIKSAHTQVHPNSLFD